MYGMYVYGKMQTLLISDTFHLKRFMYHVQGIFRTLKASIHQIKYEYSFPALQRTLPLSNVKIKRLDCPGALSICFRRIILSLLSNQTADNYRATVKGTNDS